MKRRDALKHVFSAAGVRRALAMTVIIGTILNLINQGDALLSGGPVQWWRVCLTYCVPFFVSSYGAYSALRSEI